LVDTSYIVQFLSAISSVAVIAGAIFIVFQLRQNARLIQATIHETKASTSIALLEKITDESFARRRKAMRDTVKKYAALNWQGFDDSLEDFEARNFAYTYELIGQLARQGIIDLDIVRDALQYLVVFDWDAFAPLLPHLMERRKEKINVNIFANFQWLADTNREHMKRKEIRSTAENS
jgi:hypothetical protein